MADSDQNLDNRMWRIEQQQRDIFARLDKLDGRIEEVEKRQGDRMYRVEKLENKIDEIEKKGHVTVAATSGLDSTIRVIVYGVIAGLAALFGGQAVNLTGLLK